MRILFMGTPEFAVPSLKILEKNHEIIGVFTKVDKINQRGKKIEYLPVKQYATDKNIEIYQPTSLKTEECYEIIKKLNPDLIVVVAYGKIIPKNIIDIPKYGIINVHSSLLPRFRGAAPINAAIMAGDKKSGVTIMYVEEGLDTGNIILSAETEISEEDNFLSLHDRLKEIGASILIEAVALIEKSENNSIVQNESFATFVKPFRKNDLKIDWNQSQEEIFNFVRGLSPSPCSWTTLEGKLLKIYDVKKHDKIYETGKIGEIVDKVKGKGPVIKVLNGSIIITSAKPESKKILAGSDLLNGNFIKIGDIIE